MPHPVLIAISLPPLTLHGGAVLVSYPRWTVSAAFPMTALPAKYITSMASITFLHTNVIWLWNGAAASAVAVHNVADEMAEVMRTLCQ
jgi:hypothetical protein